MQLSARPGCLLPCLTYLAFCASLLSASVSDAPLLLICTCAQLTWCHFRSSVLARGWSGAASGRTVASSHSGAIEWISSRTGVSARAIWSARKDGLSTGCKRSPSAGLACQVNQKIRPDPKI